MSVSDKELKAQILLTPRGLKLIQDGENFIPVDIQNLPDFQNVAIIVRKQDITVNQQPLTDKPLSASLSVEIKNTNSNGNTLVETRANPHVLRYRFIINNQGLIVSTIALIDP
ncbi:MAG: hypothetical protein NTY75_02885 [Candidatus Shapirobacteria bacterium]|nr:hypothetical protein [Candidatus Shapirobacteria bacterium]